MRHKYIVPIILSILLFSLSSNANAEVPPDILQAAQSSFAEFVPGLQVDKGHFNITRDYSLAEGYPYYIVAFDALKAHKLGEKISLSKLFVSPGGYIIPIKVGNKQASIAQVEYFEGKWKVVQVSGDETLESDIIFAKEKVKEALALDLKSKDIKLIYDNAFGMRALAVQSEKGEFLMPFVENNSLALKRGELMSLNDILIKLKGKIKIESYINEKVDGLGDGEVDSTPSFIYWWINSMVLLSFLSMGAIFLYYKRMQDV